MNRVKLVVSGEANLYRFSGFGLNKLPKDVEFFVKNRSVRDVVGRWLPCPNWSVSSAIQGKFGLKP